MPISEDDVYHAIWMVESIEHRGLTPRDWAGGRMRAAAQYLGIPATGTSRLRAFCQEYKKLAVLVGLTPPDGAGGIVKFVRSRFQSQIRARLTQLAKNAGRDPDEMLMAIGFP